MTRLQVGCACVLNGMRSWHAVGTDNSVHAAQAMPTASWRGRAVLCQTTLLFNGAESTTAIPAPRTRTAAPPPRVKPPSAKPSMQAVFAALREQALPRTPCADGVAQTLQQSVTKSPAGVPALTPVRQLIVRPTLAPAATLQPTVPTVSSNVQLSFGMRADAGRHICTQVYAAHLRMGCASRP